MALSTTSLSFTSQVPVFDAQICVGAGRSSIGPAASRAALLAELDRHGVARALACHIHAEEFSPLRGNQLLEPWLGDDDRLAPLWSALPTSDSLAQIEQLQRAGRVRVVRLAAAQGLPLADWTHGELFDWLSAAELPLWLALPEFDARDLVAVLRGYPRLQVVLTGAHYSQTLLAHKLLAALPGTYLELSRFESLDAIGDLVRQFGAGRLLYGSGYPRYAIGPLLYMLHRSGLTDAALAQICAGNLEQLLGLVGARR
jgi:predicted TIM-barrel fold metal-dependent hydrolase